MDVEDGLPSYSSQHLSVSLQNVAKFPLVFSPQGWATPDLFSFNCRSRSVAFSSVPLLPSELSRWAKCFSKWTLCPGWGFVSAECSARAFSCLACDTCYLPVLGWGLLCFAALQHCWFELNLWSAVASVSLSAECCLTIYSLCFVVRCSSLRVKYVVCPYWIASWLFQTIFPIC